MTEQLDADPAIAASSYPGDERLLDELRAGWPPADRSETARRGYALPDLTGREPVEALRLTDRYAIALLPEDEPKGAFLVVPLVRDAPAGATWRQARAGDGLSAFVAGVPLASERAIEADQTNASVVVGDRAILKWFRRVGPEPSRAATLLAHLAAVGFRDVPTPLGSVAWTSPGGATLTLVQGDAYLPGARDGWDWCVGWLQRHVAHEPEPCPPACDPWIGVGLGRLVTRLHAALAMPSVRIPEPIAAADPATPAAWRTAAQATLHEAIEQTREQDPEAGAALRSIEAAIRADIDTLPVDRSIQVQPVHGDLHVGQVLKWSGGWAVIDFDGNPTLPGAANALRQPVERDVAQMLSSLDHVGRIVAARSGPESEQRINRWIARTRAEFLEAAVVDPVLLAAFEAEQEARELVYAARFLPRWRYAPLATLRARYG